MPYRRKKRTTLGMSPRRMSKSAIANVLVGSIEQYFVIVPVRDTSNIGTAHVYDGSDTQDEVGPSTVVKYINLRYEGTIRNVGNAFNGWIEYALIIQDDAQGTPAVDALITANIGTQTMGDICVNLYRDKCIWNGALPIAHQTPMVADIKIKMPPQFCRMKRGMYLTLLTTFRTRSATDLDSEARLVTSHQYKAYR